MVIVSFLVSLVVDIPLTFSESHNIPESTQNAVQITKSSTNSYGIIDGQTAFVGPFFDTTYIITGSNISINKSKDLTISTIRDDFIQSPTIGYIVDKNDSQNSISSNGTNSHPSLSNPFVSLDVINKTISQKLSNAFNSTSKANYSDITIKCVFDMNISNWKCNAYGFLK
jgi:hypothetical protein